MPCATPDLQREYGRKWLAERRAAWFAENGACVKCGSNDRLELDHIDPATKVANSVWSWAKERREAELAKCQVLCHDCHLEKTISELKTPLVHGTIAAYKGKGCRCEHCRRAVREHQAKWRALTGKH